jgi:hypothetical protein
LTHPHKLQQGLLLAVLKTGKCWSSSNHMKRLPLLESSAASDTFLALLKDGVDIEIFTITKRTYVFALTAGVISCKPS